MGQPSHPNGSRVNSIQVADNSISWYANEKPFFIQSYLLSMLFKFIRHWLNASLVIPYNNPWYNGYTNRLSRLKSRRAKPIEVGALPNLEWSNNVPAILESGTKDRTSTKNFSGVALRYFRKLPASFFLKDSLGDILRPSTILKRPRRSFTF